MKLFEQIHLAGRAKHYSPRTEQAYARWIERFLRFHRDKAGRWTHPEEMDAANGFMPHVRTAWCRKKPLKEKAAGNGLGLRFLSPSQNTKNQGLTPTNALAPKEWV